MLLILLACTEAEDLTVEAKRPTLLVEDYDCANQADVELEAEPVAMVSVMLCDDDECWMHPEGLHAVQSGHDLSFSCNGWGEGDFVRVSYFVH
jgi:hypothetical protein